MSNTAWLVVALMIVFGAVGSYALGISIARKRLEARLREASRAGH